MDILLEVMATQSTDLNISQSVWDYMTRPKDWSKPTFTESLSLVLQDVWNNLPTEKK